MLLTVALSWTPIPEAFSPCQERPLPVDPVGRVYSPALFTLQTPVLPEQPSKTSAMILYCFDKHLKK